MAVGERNVVPRDIRILTPDGHVRAYLLEQERVVVGRSSSAELCYADDAGLSRQHLAFEYGPEGWTVVDLGSKNGTTVNGDRIAHPHPLRSGDRISAGHLTIEFGAAPALNTVVFVEGREASTAVESSVSTSLSGVLSADSGSGTQRIEGNPQVKALIRVGRELAGHQSLDELFHLIMTLAVDAVGADRGVLMTLEGDDLVVRAARGEGFRISSGVRDRVLSARESLLVRDARADDTLRNRMSIVEHQVRSMIAVPLQTDKRVIGLIYLDSPHFLREFTREDLNLLTVMANVAAIRIEHQRLNEVEAAERVLARDMSQAAEIQKRLLPEAAPEVPGLDLAGYNSPCRTVGGDYYDFIDFGGGKVAAIVADVAGKGMPAALMMSSLQARVQVLFDDADGVAARVGRLNRAVCAKCPDNRFITFFACMIDAEAGRITYCNAGHNPPLLVKSDGSVKTLAGGGMILGILPAAPYAEETVEFDPGDVLVLFSDGVTEACPPDRDEEFGEDRLAAMVSGMNARPAAAIAEGVIAKLMEWMAGAPAADDITLVIARRL